MDEPVLYLSGSIASVNALPGEAAVQESLNGSAISRGFKRPYHLYWKLTVRVTILIVTGVNNRGKLRLTSTPDWNFLNSIQFLDL